MYMNREGIQFGYKDTWCLDHTLSPILLKAILKFKEVAIEGESWRKGLPAEFWPEGKSMEDSLTDEEWDEAFSNFAEAVDKMIFAFTPNNDPDGKDYDYEFVEGESHGEETPEGTYRWDMKPDNEDEWKRYLKEKQEYEEKCQEGRELFGKYLHCLWW